MLLYFAYGSNMSQRRLRARIANAQIIGTALLRGYRLCFHKLSQMDGSGKCDIVQAQQENKVYGVLYALSDADQSLLDRIEGAGVGYERVEVDVLRVDGAPLRVITYKALTTNPELKPFHWYKDHVVRGAKENRLPEDYIQEIETIESIEDHDPERRIREMRIYGEH